MKGSICNVPTVAGYSCSRSGVDGGASSAMRPVRCAMRGSGWRRSPTFPALPAWHHGRFEAYAQDYAGLVDVIITDPPYGKDNLPCYEALATFAATVLTPGAGSSPWWVTSSALRWSAAGMPWAGGSMCTSSRIGCWEERPRHRVHGHGGTRL